MLQRCDWSEQSELMREYHDKEWGIPQHDDIALFEFLILDGFQAGLSWSIILKKRDNLRNAFDNFIPEKISHYSENKINDLLNDKSIIRNKSKILSVINNAKAFIRIQNQFGSFDKFIWSFVNEKPIQNEWESLIQLPSSSELSFEISRTLYQNGFKFVGPTICYAFMQSIGLVNDHLRKCYRYDELLKTKI